MDGWAFSFHLIPCSVIKRPADAYIEMLWVKFLLQIKTENGISDDSLRVWQIAQLSRFEEQIKMIATDAND